MQQILYEFPQLIAKQLQYLYPNLFESFLQLLLIDFQFLTQFSHRHFIFFGNFDLERKPAPDALRLQAVDDFLNFLPREINRLSRVKSSWFGEVESLIEAEMDAAYLVLKEELAGKLIIQKLLLMIMLQYLKMKLKMLKKIFNNVVIIHLLKNEQIHMDLKISRIAVNVMKK